MAGLGGAAVLITGSVITAGEARLLLAPPDRGGADSPRAGTFSDGSGA
jgi:hypothetical protein